MKMRDVHDQKNYYITWSKQNKPNAVVFYYNNIVQYLLLFLSWNKCLPPPIPSFTHILSHLFPYVTYMIKKLFLI